ncbi:hypothetical protein ACIPWY_03595 [Streptomyces sp. NPDC090032]|uniref:hypothetical protein n=1 Tax=Streptomyces sp. NPDC090032 TaxID=3365925 RepID=UPI003822C99D
MVLVSWHPDSANIRAKLQHASYLTAFKNALGFAQPVLEADTLEEASRGVLEELVGAARSES